MLSGVIVYHVEPDEYQKAVELGGQAYRERYDHAPELVALPRTVDPAGLNLWSLELAKHPAPAGCVMIGMDEVLAC